MASETSAVPLGAIITLQRGFDLPTQSRTEGAVPIVSSSGVSGRHAEARAKGPGVVTGRYGTIGQVFYINEDFWPLNTTLFVSDFKGNNPRFISYLLQTIDFLAYSDKSGVPGVNRNHIHQVLVRQPPLVEQESIAYILGTLDDKIELNRRMNATLEAIARTLFQSWFVNFDPVRAKSEGREPEGMDAETAALFPDAFEHSELGPIPVGWRVGVLGDLCQVTIGGDWGEDAPFPQSEEVICLRGVDLERLRDDGWSDAPRRYVKQRSIESRTIHDNQVLIAASGAGPCGRPLWAAPQLRALYGMPVVYSNFCKRFETPSPAYAVFVDRFLANMQRSRRIWEFIDGTSVPNLNTKGLLSTQRLIIPPESLLQRFYQFSLPVAAKLYGGENRTLAATRDALLPKLISGQVQVPADMIRERMPEKI